MDGPQAHIRSLPPEGAECRGSKPACAGLDGTKARRVSRLAQASLRAAGREA
jgi:hypothetical protein